MQITFKIDITVPPLMPTPTMTHRNPTPSTPARLGRLTACKTLFGRARGKLRTTQINTPPQARRHRPIHLQRHPRLLRSPLWHLTQLPQLTAMHAQEHQLTVLLQRARSPSSTQTSYRSDDEHASSSQRHSLPYTA